MRHHFSQYIEEELGSKGTRADPGVYRKPILKKDETKYYAYLIVYVDGMLCIHENPKEVMDKVEDLYRLKDVVSSPTIHLGTGIREWKYQDDIGIEHGCWAFGS